MSHIHKFYISEIQQDICSKLKTVCENVFSGHRPSSTPKQMNEFIISSINYTTRDRGAFQVSYYDIGIFVRNLGTGVENTKRLQELLDGVMALFPIKSGNGRYSLSSPYFTVVGDDGMDFTAWAIRSSIIINTTDSYNFKLE